MNSDLDLYPLLVTQLSTSSTNIGGIRILMIWDSFGVRVRLAMSSHDKRMLYLIVVCGWYSSERIKYAAPGLRAYYTTRTRKSDGEEEA